MRVMKHDKVRIPLDRAYYCGTVATVLDVFPFHTAKVQMFDGKVFTMSSFGLEVVVTSR